MCHRNLIALALLVCGAAAADQAEWVAKDIATKAAALLDEGAELRHFCPPCGDKAYRKEVAAYTEVQETDSAGQFTVLVNSAPIDLAYVYVEKDGKWSNLGKLVGAKVDSVPEVLPADLPVAMADFDRVKYIGTIDGRLLVSLELSKMGNDVNGTYCYSDVGTMLILTGEADALGAFTLTETDSEANKTGAFTGKLSEGGAKAEGTWSNPDGSKKLPFALKRVALYGDENGSIVAGSQGTETHLDFPVFLAGFGPAYTAVNEGIQNAIRPRFAEYAAQFAATAAELGLDAPHGMDDEGGLGQTISIGDHMILLANEQVVSVLFNVSLFQGGAHGMTLSLPVNLRISKKGEAYQVKPITLSEILKPGPESLTALSDFLLAELKKKNASAVVNGETKAFKMEDLSAFTLSPKGVTFYFDPYAVASYAEGAFQVLVPLADLPAAFAAEALAGVAPPK